MAPRRLTGRRRAVALIAVSALMARGSLSGCGEPSVPIGRSHSSLVTTSTVTASAGSAEPTTEGASAGTVPAQADSWLTYAHDASRSGVDSGAPPAGRLDRRWVTTVDGDVLAEPLVADGEVVVATERDTVYALDAVTGRAKWSTNIGSPVPGDQLPCGDIDPSGITGTPAIDAAAGVVWVVAFDGRSGRAAHRLVGLDITTGAVRSSRAADAPGSDATVEQQRAALIIQGGRVVIAYGGLYGDCGDYHGEVVSLPEAGAAAVESWTVRTAREGGIWAPAGPVGEPDGSLLISIGNAASTSVYDDANAILRLSAGLAPVDLWAPSNWAALSASDQDESSTSPALLDGGQVLTVGKEGTGYLLDGRHLGGVGGEVARAAICPGSGAYGGTATLGSMVFEPCRDGLRAVQAGPGARLTVRWQAPGTFPGAPLVAGGLVWIVDREGTVRGLDPASGRVVQQAVAGRSASPFASAAAAGGWLYVPAGDRVIGFSGV